MEKIIQVGSNCNPETTVIVVDERKSRVCEPTSSLELRKVVYFVLISVQSLRSLSASPPRSSPAKTTSIRSLRVARTVDINERNDRSCLLSGPE